MNRLQQKTGYDALTGLANRDLFLETLQRRLDQRKTDPSSDIAVLCFDIDRFRRLNGALGRRSADLVLQLFAARLENSRYRTECIARTGADEFAILLEGCKEDQDALDHVARIQSLVFEPFWIGSQDIFISISSGVARMVREYRDSNDVLREAEIALHQAKTKGVGSSTLYRREMQSDTVRDLASRLLTRFDSDAPKHPFAA